MGAVYKEGGLRSIMVAVLSRRTVAAKRHAARPKAFGTRDVPNVY